VYGSEKLSARRKIEGRAVQTEGLLPLGKVVAAKSPGLITVYGCGRNYAHAISVSALTISSSGYAGKPNSGTSRPSSSTSFETRIGETALTNEKTK
jgi:hypothetical protein